MWMYHRVKIKENEKRDKYLDLAKELKKTLWDMRAMVISTVISALGTIPKDLVKGLKDLVIGGQVGTIHINAVLRSARIVRTVLET